MHKRKWMTLAGALGALSLAKAATLVVDTRSPVAADTNVGTRAAPLKTVSAAAARAEAGDEVLVRPGIYREAVTLTRSGAPGRPIVFRSEVLREAVISGADVVTNWQREAVGIVSFPIPPTHTITELGGNPQWVYLDGLPLERADTRDRLIPGTFCQDLDGRRVYVALPEESDSAQVTLEYACREGLFFPDKPLDDIHIRGFTLRHNANWFRGRGPLRVTGQRWLVEDNHVQWTSYGGVQIVNSGACVVRSNLVEWAGCDGMGGSFNVDMLLEGNTVRYNNWRSFDWGMEGGGSKFSKTIDACYRGNIVAYNFGPGLWNDGMSAGTIYEKNLCHDNAVRSIFSEINWDEVIQDNLVYNTGDPGINISNGPGIVIRRNVVFNCSIGVGLGGNYTRPYEHEQKWWREVISRMAKVPGLAPHRLTLFEAQFLKYGVAPKACLNNNCVVWDNLLFDNGIGLIEGRDYRTPSAIDAFVNNFSDYNIYWTKSEKQLFCYSYKYWYESLDAWRKASGRDEHSVFADPRDPKTTLPAWAQASRKDWDLKMRPLHEGRGGDFFASPMAQIAVGRMLRSAVLEPVKFQDARVCGSVFEVDGQRTLALWTASPAERRYVRLKLGVPKITVENGYLAKRKQDLPNGNVDVLVTYNPTYLRGIGATFSESPSGVLQAQIYNVANRPVPASVTFVNEGREAATLKAGFSSSSGFTVEPAAVSHELAAGEKREIPLTLKPDGTFGRGTGMLRMEAVLGQESIRRVAVFTVGESDSKLPKAPGVITVDGRLDDWGAVVKDAVPLATVNDASQVLAGPQHGWKGPQDLSARFYGAWTEEALYLAVAVQDDQVIAASGSKDEWGSVEVTRSDAVQVSLDGRAPDMQWQREVNKGCYDVTISPTAQDLGPAFRGYNWRVAHVKDVQMATTRTPAGYTVEMKIPLTAANFPDGQWQAGRPVRLSLVVFDADDPAGGAQRKILGWGVSRGPAAALGRVSRNSEDTSGWATVILK
jgi:hypothetical protein